jgi:DNA invertase Pin-like site-specific DNA recombinase
MRRASKQKATGSIYGYARISFMEGDPDQAARGVSIDTQRERIQSYVAYQQSCGAIGNAAFGNQGWVGVRQQGEDTEDGFYVDRDTSAYKKAFLVRPAGRRLSAVLEPGDHVVFSRLDRAFRNVRDALTTIEIWQRRNIGIHFLDPQVDLSTAHGRAFLQMSAVWAEFSSALHSERMREVNAQARRQGRTLNGRKAVGWKLAGDAHAPQPDYEERAILAFIVYLREGQRLSWRKISDVIERRLATKENRLPIPSYEGDSARRFGFMRCARAYKVAKELALEPAGGF